MKARCSSGALPLPAVWENGAWRTDEYDELAETSYGQAVDIQMALTVPKTVLAAFGQARGSTSRITATARKR